MPREKGPKGPDKPGDSCRMNEDERRTETQDDHVSEERFRIEGSLSMRKIMEYLPAMIVTNISTLLLISIDGLVVGNLVGDDALASVSFFSPMVGAIGVVTAVVSMGAATSLSTCMGRQDPEGMQHLKSAVNVTAVVVALLLTAAQIPLAYAMIASYHLEPELYRMTWQYAIGIMIATPFGLISTLGVYQMQIMGRMKYLMYLAVMEGVINTLLDLLFVGPLHMGVAGAGFGSAGANVIRCLATVIILWRTTDIYRTGGKKPRKSDVKEVLTCGLPDATTLLMSTVQSYCMMQILLMAFGGDGGVIRGVTVFCYSLANVIISGIQASMRPLTGLMSGAKDSEGLKIIMRQGMVLVSFGMSMMIAVYLLFPDFFFQLHGVDPSPEGGDASLRIYSLFLLFKGMDALFLLYFTNRKDKVFATVLSVLGNGTLPVFAFILCKLCPAPWVWLSYLLTESIILALNFWRYRWWNRRDAEAEESGTRILHLSVRQAEAKEAADMIRDYGEREGIPQRITSRIALCLEEVVGNAARVREVDEYMRRIRRILRKSLRGRQRRAALLRLRHMKVRQFMRQDRVEALLGNLGEGEAELVRESRRQLEDSLERLDEIRRQIDAQRKEAIENLQLDFNPARDLPQFREDFRRELDDRVETQIIVRMTPKEGALVLIDDGRPFALEENSELQEMIADSVEQVKKLSRSVEHQYVLDMNYTTITV